MKVNVNINVQVEAEDAIEELANTLSMHLKNFEMDSVGSDSFTFTLKAETGKVLILST